MYVCETSSLRLQPQLLSPHSPRTCTYGVIITPKVRNSTKYIVNNLGSYNVRNFEVKYNHVIIFIWFIRFYTIMTYTNEFWFGLAQVAACWVLLSALPSALWRVCIKMGASKGIKAVQCELKKCTQILLP